MLAETIDITQYDMTQLVLKKAAILLLIFHITKQQTCAENRHGYQEEVSVGTGLGIGPGPEV